MIRSLLAVSALFAAQPAQAEWKSGNELLKNCEDGAQNTVSGAIDFGFCHGYIQGVVDGSRISTIAGGPDNSIKLPAGVTASQMRDVVVDYLRKNPQNRHWAASDLVYIALKGAFLGD